MVFSMCNGCPLPTSSNGFTTYAPRTLCSIDLLHHSAVFCMFFSSMCTRSLDACSSERQWGVSFFVSWRDHLHCYLGVTVYWLAFCATMWEMIPIVERFHSVFVGREWPFWMIWILMWDEDGCAIHHWTLNSGQNDLSPRKWECACLLEPWGFRDACLDCLICFKKEKSTKQGKGRRYQGVSARAYLVVH